MRINKWDLSAVLCEEQKKNEWTKYFIAIIKSI